MSNMNEDRESCRLQSISLSWLKKQIAHLERHRDHVDPATVAVMTATGEPIQSVGLISELNGEMTLVMVVGYSRRAEFNRGRIPTAEEGRKRDRSGVR